MKEKFSVDDYSHYIFTPRDLTHWTLGILRYDLTGVKTNNSPRDFIDIFIHEAKRNFRDKLVGHSSCEEFDRIVSTVLQGDWNLSLHDLSKDYYVTWGAAAATTDPESKLLRKKFGAEIGSLSKENFKEVIEKGLVSFGKPFEFIAYNG